MGECLPITIEVRCREGYIREVVDVSLEGILPTDENLNQIELFLPLWTSLLGDSPMGLRPRKTVRKFLRRLQSEGIVSVVREFTELQNRLLHSLGGAYHDPVEIDELVEHFQKTPIFFECLACLRERSDAPLSFVLSFLTYGRKLELDDPSLDAQAFEKWLGVEQRLGELELDPNLTKPLSRVIHWLLQNRGYTDGYLVPFPRVLPVHHGPGTSRMHGRNKADPFQKSRHLAGVGKSASGYAFKDTLEMLGYDVPDRRPDVTEVRESELFYVPKTAYSRRSVCREEPEIMFLQQGLLGWFERAFRDGNISRFVDLRDQTRSRALAQLASSYCTCDTLDLSSASDSVAWKLVLDIFPEEILPFLEATRSGVVNYGKERIRVHKFAPMGSAVCFPVQCLIFTAISLLEYTRAWYGDTDVILNHRWGDLDKVFLPMLKRRPTPFLVGKFVDPILYGDDFIVDSRRSIDIIKTLETLGFSVNIAKSFMGGCTARESCGIYAVGGYDVTPLIYQVALPSSRDISADAARLQSIIEHINSLAREGYKNTARVGMKWFRDRWLRTPYPRFHFYVGPDPKTLGFYHHTQKTGHLISNKCAVEPWRTSYMCYTMTPVLSKGAESAMSELYRYAQWQLAHERVEGTLQHPGPSPTQFALREVILSVDWYTPKERG